MYPGGKNGSGVYQAIINQFPPHRTYIEPFLGGAAIMRMKLPALASIGIDIDADVVRKSAGLEIPNLELLNEDALSFLKSYAWQGDEVVYCDPPYLLETRRCKHNIYRHEMGTKAEHLKLLRVLKSIRSNIAISGYWSELYASELQGWRTLSFQTSNRGGRAIEWLWMNYPPPVMLHDYRYLGKTFRERERIKRKQQRWKARLAKMPDLERYALLSAIADIASSNMTGAARAPYAISGDAAASP